MDRTKFIMSLARQEKLAFVSDVGDVSVSSSRPKRACRSSALTKKNDEHDSEEKSPSTSFVDYESSGSEYIPASNGPSSMDLESVENWDSHSTSSFNSIIPIQRNINVAADDLLHPSALQCLTNVDYGDIEPAAPQCTYELLFGKNAAETVFSTENNCLANNLANSDEHPVANLINNLNKQNYTKKEAARERPTICPICYNDVATHFTRHLLRHHGDHKDVKLLKSYKPRSLQRLNLVASLRKQGYFHLNVEKGVLNPVRRSKDPNADYFVCEYCLGHYSKKLLYKHVKICKNKPRDLIKPGVNCLTKSQTFMASITSKNHDFLKSSRIRAEVFRIMRPDNISAVAKNDPMICLYGETLLNKHKRQQMCTVVSNKIREMARLLIALKSINTEIDCLFDALRPDMFQYLISATKIISGFDVATKSFKSPSLALHMGTSLKVVCDAAFKIVLEKKNIPKIKWTNRDEKKMEIKELRKLIEGHWCNELSSLALKNLKDKQWEKPIELPLTSDIQAFQLYLNNRADEAYNKLYNGQSQTSLNYKTLTECVLGLTVMFNRKRIGDVQYLKIETYTADKSVSNQEAFMQSLTAVEQIISKKFKRVVTGGKGSKPVPILFSSRLQKFISCLIELRTNTNIVPKSNPYLFANPGSENRWMSGSNVIRRLAQDCGVKNSALLTSTKFRKHIATTLQLMTMEDNEIEQVATFMGHTKKTHAEFYRLPQDIYQTAKVAKVLLLLEKGKGKEFQGKSLNDIEIQKDVYYSSESECNEEEDEAMPLAERVLNRGVNCGVVEVNCAASSSRNTEENSDKDIERGSVVNKNVTEESEGDLEDITGNESGSTKKKTKKIKNAVGNVKQSGRRRWTEAEKKIVLKYFQHHIKKKITPKKHECEELISGHRDLLKDKDWVKVKTLVYNSFREK